MNRFCPRPILAFSLMAAFVLSDSAAAIFSSSAGSSAWWVCLITVAAVIPFLLLWSRFCGGETTVFDRITALGRLPSILFLLIILLFSLFSIIVESMDEAIYASSVFFATTPTSLIYVIVLFSGFLCAAFGSKAVLSLSLPAVFAVLPVVLIYLWFAMSSGDMRMLIPLNDGDDLISGGLNLFAKTFADAVLVFLFLGLFPKKNFGRAAVLGFITAGILSSAIAAGTVMILGGPETARLLYPVHVAMTDFPASGMGVRIETMALTATVGGGIVRIAMYAYLAAVTFDRLLHRGILPGLTIVSAIALGGGMLLRILPGGTEAFTDYLYDSRKILILMPLCILISIPAVFIKER